MEPYLKDGDAAVRLAAVKALTETVPPGAGPALAAALTDGDGRVSAAAAASLRELAEVLAPEPELRVPLVTALTAVDPTARGTALDVLRALRLGDTALFAAHLADPDTDVRLAAVRALVSVDAAEALSGAAGDAAREVRVAVARGFAALAPHLDRDRREHAEEGTPAALHRLIHDPDVLVRAAALETLGALGVPHALLETVTAALNDPAWQVRTGAATALGAAAPDHGVPALAELLRDADADVRKAAVLALSRHAGHEDARTALSTAVDDPDADVRAYASRAVR
ncbi:HEAT repeat domain-containing protein [Streptomyces sp. NPDC059010]|uniref:HEAT repeat domain-containing protein n=1 Tax=Streptomyces sp. NPDC059010 TaxID=3346695 RepID=UPI003676B509